MRFGRDKWVQMKKTGGFFSMAKSHQKDVNRHFFLVNECGGLPFFPHKVKQKHFFREKKYETCPRAKKEAAVGDVFKHVLVSMITLVL